MPGPRRDERFLKHSLAYRCDGEPKIEYLDVVITRCHPGSGSTALTEQQPTEQDRTERRITLEVFDPPPRAATAS